MAHRVVGEHGAAEVAGARPPVGRVRGLAADAVALARVVGVVRAAPALRRRAAAAAVAAAAAAADLHCAARGNNEILLSSASYSA